MATPTGGRVMSLGPTALVLVTVGAVLLASVACRRSEPAETTPTALGLAAPTATPAPTPTPTPVPIDPYDLLRRSGTIMGGLETFHFRLHHERGSLELLPAFFVDEGEGDVANPDRLSITFTGSIGGGFAIRSGIITLGESSYMINPLTGKWEAAETGVSPLGFFSPSRGIGAMLSQLDEVILLKPDRGEKSAYRIRGVLGAEALAPLVGETLTSVAVDVELTLDSKRLYLLQAKITGNVKPTDAEDPIRIITLSDFEKPISIEAPI